MTYYTASAANSAPWSRDCSMFPIVPSAAPIWVASRNTIRQRITMVTRALLMLNPGRRAAGLSPSY